MSMRNPTRCTPSGVTLLELLVVIALIGIIASMTMLAFPPDRTPTPNDPLVSVARARTLAVEQARPVSISLVVSGRPVDALALPDGSVIADSVFKLDRLSGRK